MDEKIRTAIEEIPEGTTVTLQMADDSHVDVTKAADDQLVAADGDGPVNLDEVKGISRPLSSADPE
jgi:hypothetical protein